MVFVFLYLYLYFILSSQMILIHSIISIDFDLKSIGSHMANFLLNSAVYAVGRDKEIEIHCEWITIGKLHPSIPWLFLVAQKTIDAV